MAKALIHQRKHNPAVLNDLAPKVALIIRREFEKLGMISGELPVPSVHSGTQPRSLQEEV
jgi:hypothetical protein